MLLLLGSVALSGVVFKQSARTAAAGLACEGVFLAAGFILGLASASQAPFEFFALAEWSRFVALTGMAWLIVLWSRRYQKAGDICLGVVLVSFCGLYVWGRLAAYLAGSIENLNLDSAGFFTGFSNRRFFAQVQTMTMPLLGCVTALLGGRYALRIRAARALKVLVWAIYVGWWVLAFVSSARGTWVGLACGLGLAMFVCPASARRLLRTYLIGALVGWLLFVLAFEIAPRLRGAGAVLEMYDADHYVVVADRLTLWSLAVDAVLRHPWLGLGP
ncbi:MAG: O-antigen ligase family protein, partial [Rhodocyclaceae bacterium]|nr:O-antigen ligase family protein [Rhodocyclaceae bacterium]